jgi:hypothetical protein
LVINVQAPTTVPTASTNSTIVTSAVATTNNPVVRTDPTTTVPVTTSTTPVTTTTALTAPLVPELEAGDASVSVGGTARTPTLERRDNAITVTAGDFAATFSSTDSDGRPTPLDPDGNVRLKPGDNVQIKMSGFAPGSGVEAWLFSTPMLLGRATVSTDGSIDTVFTLPKDIPAGAHRIALKAVTDSGDETTVSLGVMVGDWQRETNRPTMLIVAIVLAAVIGALMMPAVSRRRRRA